MRPDPSQEVQGGHTVGQNPESPEEKVAELHLLQRVQLQPFFCTASFQACSVHRINALSSIVTHNYSGLPFQFKELFSRCQPQPRATATAQP